MSGKSDTSGSSSSAEQLSLELFPPRTFASLCTERNLPGLSIHFNRRLKNSWYVRIHRGSEQRELHVPAVFDHAPEQVKTALIEWATLPKTRGSEHKKIVRLRRHVLEERVRSYLCEHVPASIRSKEIPSQKWPTQGCNYDLKEVFDTLNSRYFNTSLHAFLRWGTGASKTSYQTTRKDSAGIACHYITIAGVYNHPEVPRFAIEAIMYHEMLHIHIPPRNERGRNVIHGPEFKKLEHAFPHFCAWHDWEKGKLHSLRSRMRRKRKIPLLRQLMSFLPGA